MGYTLVDREDPSVEVMMGRFRKIRRALGATAFGLNEVALPPGAEGMEHDEADFDEEEVYVGLEGEGTFTIDGEDVPFRAGQYLRVDPASRRLVRAGDAGLRFLAIGARQGGHSGRSSL